MEQCMSTDSTGL